MMDSKNPETIEIHGNRTIHKLCKFAADRELEGSTFTEIVDRLLSEIEALKSKTNMLDEGWVMVPSDKIYSFYQDSNEPENFCNTNEGFDVLGNCIDLGDIMKIEKHIQANIKTEKFFGTWIMDYGNPLERSRSKFFVGSEMECNEIILENERVYEAAQGEGDE